MEGESASQGLPAQRQLHDLLRGPHLRDGEDQRERAGEGLLAGAGPDPFRATLGRLWGGEALGAGVRV